MRLWTYAIAVTAAAIAAGYFAFQLHAEEQRLSVAYAACSDALEPVEERAHVAERRAQACEDDILGVHERAEANDRQLALMQSNLSATREELEALRAQRVEAEKRLAEVAKLQEQLAKMVDTGQLKVSARRGSLVVELPAEVLFRSASAELSEQGQLSVLEVGFILKQFPERRFLVVGHTDSLPLKNAAFRDNWQLSTARALTVTHVLVKAGVKPSALIAAGAGEHDPLRNNSRAEDRRRNRRIEIQLLPAIAELPRLPVETKPTAPKAAA